MPRAPRRSPGSTSPSVDELGLVLVAGPVMRRETLDRDPLGAIEDVVVDAACDA
jgi:hypothetical protein